MVSVLFFHNFIKLHCGYNGQRITGVLVGAVKFLHPTMQYEDSEGAIY